MTLTAKLTAALAFVLLLVGSHWYVYKAGNRNGTNAVLVGALTASNAALTKRATENEAISNQLAIDAKKATIDHAEEIKFVRAISVLNATKRVPVSADFCRSVTGSTESSEAGSDGQGATGGGFLPDAFGENLRRLAADADEVTADMRHLIRRVDEAKCFQ